MGPTSFFFFFSHGFLLNLSALCLSLVPIVSRAVSSSEAAGVSAGGRGCGVVARVRGGGEREESRPAEEERKGMAPGRRR